MILGGGQKRIDRQHAQGKYTARERINMLFDEGTFVETNSFVQHRCRDFGMDKRRPDGDAVITGHGTVDGRLVYVYAQDFTVIGGTIAEMHVHKINKLYSAAMKTGAPVVGLFDSGGARIQEGVDILFANFFKNNVDASGVIPQISAILGSCAGGGAYSPALTDFILMVENTSQMFITGPKVIEAVTGEKVTIDEMGSAMAHNSISGVAHFVDKTEDECIENIKELLSYLPSNNLETAPMVEAQDDPNRICEELDIIMPDNPNRSYDMKKIIYSIADNGHLFECGKYYAQKYDYGVYKA